MRAVQHAPVSAVHRLGHQVRNVRPGGGLDQRRAQGGLLHGELSRRTAAIPVDSPLLQL